MNKKMDTKSLTAIAMIAGLYATVTLAFGVFSFGEIQLRVSEALTLLAVFSPDMIIAVTLGCGVSNLVGLMIGTNPLIMDVVIGTFATFVSAVLTYKLRNIRTKGNYPIVAGIPPVIINAVVIGLEISWLQGLLASPKAVIINMAIVGAGQALPCLALGPLLVATLERTGIAKKYLTKQINAN